MHALADALRTFEKGQLIAVPPVLDGRNQRCVRIGLEREWRD